MIDLGKARQRAKLAEISLPQIGLHPQGPMRNVVASAEDVPALLEIAECAGMLLVDAPRCGSPVGAGKCPRFATKVDPFEQLWCDTHGAGLERVRDVPGAMALRRLDHLLRAQEKRR